MSSIPRVAAEANPSRGTKVPGSTKCHQTSFAQVGDQEYHCTSLFCIWFSEDCLHHLSGPLHPDLPMAIPMNKNRQGKAPKKEGSDQVQSIPFSHILFPSLQLFVYL
jgi:hypothetical protein